MGSGSGRHEVDQLLDPAQQGRVEVVEGRTPPRMCCQARAMSVWLRCGQPSCWHTPYFHSMRARHVRPPLEAQRCGFTAAQMSMNGCPTISTCLPTAGAGDALGDPALLRALDQVVDEDADPAVRAGPEVAEVVGEVVDAAEVLHDDALDAQVVAPDLLDQLGVVPALDEDPAGAGHPGLRAVDGDRARRGAGRLRRGGRGSAGRAPPACPRAGSRDRAGRYAACGAGPRGSPCRRSRSTATISPQKSVVTSSTTSPMAAGVSVARPRLGARQSVLRTSVP